MVKARRSLQPPNRSWSGGLETCERPVLSNRDIWRHRSQTRADIAALTVGQKRTEVMIHGVYVVPDLIWRSKGAEEAIARKSGNILHR